MIFMLGYSLICFDVSMIFVDIHTYSLIFIHIQGYSLILVPPPPPPPPPPPRSAGYFKQSKLGHIRVSETKGSRGHWVGEAPITRVGIA